MAAWQADFLIRVTDPWPADFERSLDLLLPRERSRGNDAVTWGRHVGTCLDVLFTDAVPRSARLRLDMRAWDAALVRQLVSALAALPCEVRQVGGSVVQPRYEDVELAARRSLACRLVASAPGHRPCRS